MADPNGVISSEATSGGEASTCLRAFCGGTFSLWLLLIVLSANKFESPVLPLGNVLRMYREMDIAEFTPLSINSNSRVYMSLC